jgi:hypothetical protein
MAAASAKLEAPKTFRRRVLVTGFINIPFYRRQKSPQNNALTMNMAKPIPAV